MIATYAVSGMTCDHCVAAVKKEVSAVPGVTGVDLALDGALTVHSESPIDFDRIVEAVAEADSAYSVA